MKNLLCVLSTLLMLNACVAPATITAGVKAVSIITPIIQKGVAMRKNDVAVQERAAFYASEYCKLRSDNPALVSRLYARIKQIEDSKVIDLAHIIVKGSCGFVNHG